MIFKRDKRTNLHPKLGSNEDYPTVQVDIQSEQLSTGHHDISILDINDNGMGITCTVPLKVGQHIIFLSNQQDWDLPEKGVVMWTFKASEGFRAGIKFL